MESAKKILIVEDDPAIRNLIHRFLHNRQNYQVESVADGERAMEVFRQFNPDLVILDINLPDVSGSRLRQEMQDSTNVCVLMLTSMNDQASRLQALSQGADDYMTKPFDLEELAIRVEVILRRIRDRKSPTQKSLTYGNLMIDPVRYEVMLDGNLISLTSLEFKLLHFLASHPGRVWTRADMIREVWGHEFVGDPRVVDVHIGHIRGSIEPDTSQPKFIHTIRGVGYKFEMVDATASE